MSVTVEAELKRKPAGSDELVAWELVLDADNPDTGRADPVIDYGVRAALDTILTAVTGILTDAQLRASLVPVKDDLNALVPLADDVGDGTVKTFDFTTPVHLVWVKCVGGEGRAAIDTDPTLSFGVVCEDGIPQPLTVTTQTLKVIADAGTVHVWGFRR